MSLLAPETFQISSFHEKDPGWKISSQSYQEGSELAFTQHQPHPNAVCQEQLKSEGMAVRATHAEGST